MAASFEAGWRGLDGPAIAIASTSVRASFIQTLEWTQRAGSTVVDDVAGEFEEVDCY